MKDLNFEALERLLEPLQLVDIENMAESFSCAATDLAVRALADSCVGCMTDGETQVAIYNIYSIGKALKQLVIDNKNKIQKI